MSDKKQANKEILSNKRNVGLQTIVQSKEYLIPSVAVTHNLETEEYPKIAALPHSVSSLLFIIGVIYFFGISSTGTFLECTRNAILGITTIIVVFGCTYLPDSVLRRPHPILWRFVTSFSIAYLIIITFLLFQDRDNARQLLTIFDNKLGKPLPEKSYGEACDLTTNEFPYIHTQNISDSVDMFITAHLLGWYVKMLIIRDVKLCWILSITFEVLEITFRHWLPNFWECWWDHAILDILGMNALGIWLGALTCKYFEMKNYKWINRINPGEKGANFMKKFLNYFTPNYWVRHEWDIFSSTKRFYSVLWFCVHMLLVDLSHFFSKYILWLPVDHYLLAIRINLWGLLGIVCAREYYEYITNETCKRIGINAWLAHLILFVELAMCYKFSEGLFTAPFPKYVVYFWTFIFLLLSGITIHLVLKDFVKKTIKKEIKIDMAEPNVEVEYVNEEKTQ